MAPGDVVALGPAPGRVPPRPPRPDGVRIVTRENGRYFDLMPSTLSSYLLPPLADCSLVRREASSAAGSLRFFGNSVELEEISDALQRSDVRTYSRASPGLVGLAVGQAAFEISGRLGTLERTVMEVTSAPLTTIAPANADVLEMLPWSTDSLPRRPNRVFSRPASTRWLPTPPSRTSPRGSPCCPTSAMSCWPTFSRSNARRSVAGAPGCSRIPASATVDASVCCSGSSRTSPVADQHQGLAAQLRHTARLDPLPAARDRPYRSGGLPRRLDRRAVGRARRQRHRRP